MQLYPAYSGGYYFCHPDMRSKNPHCTVNRMYVSTWDAVIEELGRDFVEVAFGLKSDPYFDKVVHPCCLWDGKKMFQVVMLGPFEPEEMSVLIRVVNAGTHPFYDGHEIHLAMALSS